MRERQPLPPRKAGGEANSGEGARMKAVVAVAAAVLQGPGDMRSAQQACEWVRGVIRGADGVEWSEWLLDLLAGWLVPYQPKPKSAASSAREGERERESSASAV